MKIDSSTRIITLLLVTASLFLSTSVAFAFSGTGNGTRTETETGVRYDVNGDFEFYGDLSTSTGYTVDIYAANAFLRDNTGLPTLANGIYTLYGSGTLGMINTAGFVFGPASQVQAANIIISTLNISSAEFFEGCRTGKFHFVGQGAYIHNQGRLIPQPGGYVCLLSQAINNTGTIYASLGKVVLACGEKMTLALDDLSTISVVVDEAVKGEIFGPDGKKINSAIENSGTISANGGTIELTAKVLNKVFDYAINNSGVIEAKAIDASDGQVTLTAEGAPIINTGTIEANNVKVNAINTDFLNYGKVISETLSNAPAIDTGNIYINAVNLVQDGLIQADKLVNIDVENLVTSKELIVDTNALAGDPSQIPALPAAVIRGQEVRINAKRIGDSSHPIRIDASLTYIYKSVGDINILDSLGIGTSILLRGPPDGDFAIIYFKDADLTLNAENVNVVGSDSLYLYGNITFYNFSCTIPNKEIFFEAGKTFTFKGTLNIEGLFYPEQPIKLYSQTPGEYWYLDLQTDTYNINLVAISDCYSLQAVEIPIGADYGNNVNLTIDPVWSGNGSTNNWSDSGNWWAFLPHTPPQLNEAVFFIGLGPNGNKNCFIDNVGSWSGGLFTIGGYTGTITLGVPITTGAFIQTSGNFNCGLNAMTVNGAFLQTGGTFNASSSIMTISGSFTFAGGVFNHNNGKVVFSGTGTSSVTGSAVFFDVDVELDKTINLLGYALTLDGTLNNYGTITTAIGDINITAVNITTGTITNSALSGNVYLTVLGDLIFTGAITTSDLVSLNVGGAIYDEHNGIDVIADSLELRTVNGTASRNLGIWGDVLETQVNKLAAYNASQGAINIWNKGSLIIDTIGSTSGIVNNAPAGSGNIYSDNQIWIYASDSDNLGESFFYTGPVLVLNSYFSSLTVNHAVQSSGGNINLLANSDINQKNNIATSASGKIDLMAGNSIIMDSGTKTESDTGAITYNAIGGNVLLSLIKNNGTIHILTGAGIIDNNGASNNITSTILILTAASGIGVADAIETSAIDITANNTTGNIEIDNTTAAPATSSTTTGEGDILFTQNGASLTVTASTGNGKIYINVNGGDLTINTLSAGGVNGLVSIMVSGAIYDGNDATGPPYVANINITATNLILSAANGIGSGNPIETQVSNLQATNTTSGSIEIHNFGALALDDVSGTLGYSIYNPADGVHIWASSPLTVNSKVEAKGLIKLEAKGGASGDLTINARVYSTNNRIVLNASHDIRINENGEVVTNGKNITLDAGRDAYVHGISTDGSFTDPTPPTSGIVTIIAGRNIQDGFDTNPPLDKVGPSYIYDISAYKIVLNAGGDISTGPLAPIEIRSKELEITAGGNVNLFHKGTLHLNGFTGNSSGSSFTFINSGDLYIDNPINVYGEVNITVIDDPDMYVNAPINSNGADVTLSATRNIIHSFNGDVFTLGGKFTGKADSDKNQDGFYDIQFGAEINTTGPGGDGEVVISGDDFNLSGIIDAGTANVHLKPSDGQKIALAAQASFGRFRVSNDELNNVITSGLIIIGSHQAGDITINNLDQAGRDFKLVTGGNVLEQGDEPFADIIVGTLIFDVDGDVGTILNGIETITDAVEGKVGGLIHIIEFGNLNLNVLKAQSAILETWRIFGFEGNIIGNNVGGPNLIADTVILDAADGINIDTKVDQLSARVRENDATGNINVRNTGALALDDLAGWGYSVRNFGKGNIDISTSSPITVNADVIGRRAITLTANGTNGDITINANIQSIGNNQKDINLVAGRHIIHNLGTVSTTATVNETAAKDIEMYDHASVIAGDINLMIGRDLKMENHSELSAANNINIDVGQNMKLKDHSSISGNNIYIDVAGNLVMKNHSIVSATNIVNIGAGYLGMWNNSLLEAANLVNINTTGSIEMFDNSIIQAENLVDINSGDDVIMHDNSAIQSHGNVDIAAVDDVLMYDSSTIGADNDVDIDAGGEVVVSNSSIHAGNDVFIDAVDNISLGKIDAGNSIHLNTTAGDIVDTNGNDINLTAPNLYMYAYGNIGLGGDFIDTDVSDIWHAIAYHGDVLINELNGVNLWDIQALGSTINIITGGDTYAFFLLAVGTSPADPAQIFVTVNSGKLFVNGSITAQQTYAGAGAASALIDLSATNGIDVLGGSSISATVNRNGTATVNLTTSAGDIHITDSTVQAVVNGTGTNTASITMTANGVITIDPSTILASVQKGTASITLTAVTGSITVDNSQVSAIVTNNGLTNSTASVTMNANLDINIQNGSQVIADVDNRGGAIITITTGQNVNVAGSSNIAASTGGIGSGPSVTIQAINGNVNIDSSTVSVTANNLVNAVITIIAGQNVNITNNSNITGTANNIDTLAITIQAITGNVNIDSSTVSASANNVAAVNITITAGQNVNITNSSNITATAATVSSVTITIQAINGSVGIDNSIVSASANNVSSVTINIIGGQDVNITNSSNINATATAVSSVAINIQAINGNATIDSSTVSASADSISGVTITITANQNVTIASSNITATVNGTAGTAAIIITSISGNISITSSTIQSQVTEDGTATITITALSGNISITSSSISSIVIGNIGSSIITDNAIITITAAGDITITDSGILAQVTTDDGASTITIASAAGSVTITNAVASTHSVKALVGLDGAATITITAGNNVNIHNGDIEAIVSGTTPGNISTITITANQAVSIDPTVILSSVLNGTATVTITAGTNISITDGSSITAQVTGNGTATVTMTAGQSVIITDSDITSSVSGSGTAKIDITATNKDISITDSSLTATAGSIAATILLTAGDSVSIINATAGINSVKATVAGNGTSTITIKANNGSITVTNGDVESVVNGTGTSTATVTMTAKTDILIDPSTIIASVKRGTASVTLTSNTGSISISASQISALVTNNGTNTSTATVTMTADQNVSITANSAVKATISGRGNAKVEITATNGGITVTDSSIEARTGASGTNTATVTMTAKTDITIDPSTILASVVSGTASITITSSAGSISIDNSSITSQVTGSGLGSNALITIKANQNVTIKNNSTITASANDADTVNITITATNGDVRINNSDISAIANNISSVTITITAGDDVRITNSSNITATANNIDSVTITIQALGGDVVIVSSNIGATANNVASVTITITAANDVIIVRSSNINALANNVSAVTITIQAITGDVVIVSSNIGATANNVASVNINITAGDDVIIVSNSNVSASANDVSAVAITINAGDDIRIVNSNISAAGDNIVSAAITITAGGSVTIRNDNPNTNYIKATVTGNGAATITITANGGDVTIHNGDIEAIVSGTAPTNTATVTITASQAVSIDPTVILSSVVNGTATVTITAGTTLGITDSTLTAEVTDAGSATVQTTSGGNTTITDSDILATVANDGTSKVLIKSNTGSVTITNALPATHFVKALVGGDGLSQVDITANGTDVNIHNGDIEAIVSGTAPTNTATITITANNDVNIDPTILLAQVIKGTATIGVIANNGAINITDSTISSIVLGDGNAVVLILGSLDVNIDPSIISAVVNGNGNAVIALISGFGNVTLTDTLVTSTVVGDGLAIVVVSAGLDITLLNSTITAVVNGAGNTAVILLAWGGSINADATSLITSEYAYLLARYNIGSAASPINTDVDFLAAYSWDTGSIYINEANDIQLGFIVFGVGFSVAANNGIIHIVSNGDMTVNSVISPRGGVYLESTLGSIFAGNGWCPAASGPQVFLPLYGGIPFYMDVSGTDWQTLGGVNFFAPITPSPVLGGPNVIAGGYSYFAAPTGTIGVGTPGVPDVTHPLIVNIQVIPGSFSAVPAGGFSPVAGLTLRVGGGAGTYNAGNGNGNLPISAVIQGIVRPATTAVTGVYPAFGLDLSTIPPGYVLYADSDTGICTGAMYAPAAVNTGALLQIWPPFPGTFVDFLLLVEELNRRRENAIYEIMSRFTSITPINPRAPFFYFYHPLTPMDYTAFDNITLNTGAYEFIQNQLMLKKQAPAYYGLDEELRKRAAPLR